ncbi:WecB/TagA/CpsF family glycosyltransferase [Patescibacteria group bacterium]|nr:WecB/TagA/CpsF family glycosyltransferase [Patescibacteria group bacterium]MCL5091607.1 WecB/TagA/CpsF family glycosyltransferase [Patescibacteria group bacterium]
MENKLLGIKVDNLSNSEILEYIKKFWRQPKGVCHVVSLNPENIVVAQSNSRYKKILNDAQIRINDGFGVILASRWLKINLKERVTGVDLMERLTSEAGKGRLTVLLIGARANLAESIADCYQQRYSEAKFFGLTGIKNIKQILPSEEKRIFDIVTEIKPRLVLVAFGSPAQELWLEKHRRRLGDCVAMGVGQGFDVYAGRVKRAPVWIRRIGLEWLFRLLTQPWRWKRQLRLLSFGVLVVGQKLR